MKTIKVYTRTITERTGYRKYPYREKLEFIVKYNGMIRKNTEQTVDNPKLKVLFSCFETRKKGELEKWIADLGRTNDEKNLKQHIKELLAK